MGDIYLDQTLKSKYMEDFEHKVLKNSHESWKISDKIREHLIVINNNSNVQTLYSKYPEYKYENDREESYLKIAYSESIEKDIFRKLLPMLIVKYNDKYKSKFYYLFNEPRLNVNYRDGKSLIDLGCIDNENYFNINNIHLVLKAGNINVHNEFWEFVTNKLSELK